MPNNISNVIKNLRKNDESGNPYLAGLFFDEFIGKMINELHTLLVNSHFCGIDHGILDLENIKEFKGKYQIEEYLNSRNNIYQKYPIDPPGSRIIQNSIIIHLASLIEYGFRRFIQIGIDLWNMDYSKLKIPNFSLKDMKDILNSIYTIGKVVSRSQSYQNCRSIRKICMHVNTVLFQIITLFYSLIMTLKRHIYSEI